MGHASPFAQVLSDRLGIPFDKVHLVQGDSDRSGHRWRLRRLEIDHVERHRHRAGRREGDRAGQADRLSRARSRRRRDIEFTDGRFVIAGTDRAIGIMELAQKIHWRHQSAGGRSELARRAAHQRRRLGSTFPNGCHVAEVEIDPATGVIEVVKYSCVNDFGTVINPMIVEGQLHGGVVQGIGQALMEMTVYDDDGQFLTGSYMDYALPRASDTPNFSVASHPVPATTNPLGVKGCGEAGCAGALTSVMNAVVDALSAYGIRHIDMPATPLPRLAGHPGEAGKRDGE